MDPRSSAQDVHRCDLCETAIVHSYCDFCHVNLCKPCVVDHISDGYHKHTIVPFNERRSTLIYPKCERHPHKHCELLCKDCRSFVCSSCMASEQHTGHRFVEVKHEYETKKEIIKTDKVELGVSISPKYEEIAFELENQLANLDEGYEKLTSEITKQGEEWHREIDIVIKIIPLRNAIQENVLSINKPKTSVRELLDKPELVATIQTGYHYLYSVTCLNEEIFWTSGGFSGVIKCFDIKGNIFRTIITHLHLNDIAVDDDGDLLYSDRRTKKVYKVKNGQTEMLIKCQGWTPRNLCVDSTGDLLVTMYSDDATQSKVVRYSGYTEKQTIQFDDEGKPLYSGNTHIKYITENRNNDICVADYTAGAVVVVNQDGKLRWRYTGHPSTTKNKTFKP